MIMIAFVTINSGFIPLIEGLCAQILLGFEISVLRSHLWPFLWKNQYVKKKNQLVQDLIPPPSFYTHMCTLYTYEYIYAEI